jgi:hypothetical protein
MPRTTTNTRIVDASKLPQKIRLMRHLKAVGHISNREAILDHHIVCLAKRIQELREDGVPITSHWKKHPVSGQRYTRYVLGNLAA